MTLRIQPAVFHLLSTFFFGACVPLMLDEAQRVKPWFARMERLLAVAAALLALQGLRFLVAWLVARPTAAVRGRRQVASYLLVMAAASALGMVAIQTLSAPRRPVLATFLVGAAVWLLALGMDLLPQWLLGPKLLVDRLGFTVRLEQLTWAELRPRSNARACLAAGDGTQVRLRVFGLRQDLERLQEHILEGIPKA